MSDEPMSIDAAAEFVSAMDNPPSPIEMDVQLKREQMALEDELKGRQKNAAADDQGGEIVSEVTQEAEAEATTDEDPQPEEEAEEVAAPVDAPQWWDAEDKAAFATLTPEQQAVVKRQEDKREAVIQKVKSEAQEARSAASQNIETAKALSERLAAAIPDARKAFDEYYGDIDWPEYAKQDPAAAQEDWFKYQQGLEQFNKAETAKAEAEQLWRENFQKEQAAQLAEIAPDLVKSPDSLRALGDYIVKSGVPVEQLKTASALELSIAHKAMKYDQMMAEAKSRTVTAPPKIEPKPAKIAPQGTAKPASTSQQRDIAQTRNRLAQTRSVDDAAALIAKYGY